MTDRELLKLAARAAGYKTDHPWNALRLTLEPPVVALCIPEVSTGWDPLDNDGHALHLAVKLRMSVTVFDNAVGIGIKGDFGYREYDITPDPHAATRRAITHAAAEIGKVMP